MRGDVLTRKSFGDQPFWGDMIARAGAGPVPIAFKKLTAERLAEAIQETLKPGVRERAIELAAKIEAEDGVTDGVENFYKALPVQRMKCAVFEEKVAVWRHEKTGVVLSAAAAALLVREGVIEYDDLRLYV